VADPAQLSPATMKPAFFSPTTVMKAPIPIPMASFRS
jgi:hypothetical protein